MAIPNPSVAATVASRCALFASPAIVRVLPTACGFACSPLGDEFLSGIALEARWLCD